MLYKELLLKDIDPRLSNVEGSLRIYVPERNELVSLKDALNNLNNEEKKLIYERYYNDLTQTEIAKRDNISQVKVYRLERKILDKLKDKMT